MPYFDYHGQRLYHAGRPTAGRPNLVLLHGAGGSHLVWPRALRQLPFTDVIALDLPGHGRSDPPGATSVRDYAAAVGALVTALGPDRVVLLGHSLGGAVALNVALQPPANLSGLVLLATGARLLVSEQLLAWSNADIERAADFIVSYGYSTAAPPHLAEPSRQELIACGPATLSGDLIACQEYDIRPSLGGIATPALVIGGSVDKLVPPALTAELASGLPRAAYAVLDGAGHYLMLEQPEEVARLVTDFLRQLGLSEPQ